MTATAPSDNPDQKTILAKMAGCKPAEILTYKEYPDKWVVIIQTQKTVKKQELMKNA